MVFPKICIRRFALDRRASISIVSALMIIPLAGFVAAAIDYGRAVRFKTRIAAAADAAALAATKLAADLGQSAAGRSQSEIVLQAQDLGTKFFLAEVTRLGGGTSATPAVTVSNTNGSWTTEIAYSGQIPTPFAKLVGKASVPISGTAKTTMDPGLPVLDIAMCVDSTGSMQPTLDAVKTNAMNFYNDLNTQLTAKGMTAFPLVRVRMIYFKDYGGFGTATAAMYGTGDVGDPDPMYASDFFSLPDQSGNFNAFASPQTAYGGGDTPESGLECLNTAIESVWIKPGEVPSGFTQPVTDVYPIIVIWTDAPSHPPSYPDSLAHPDYPGAATMPRDFAGLRAKWDDATKIDQTHKQILFFGDPDVSVADNYGGYDSGWTTVKTWPGFTVGGTLTEANTSMVQALATGIAAGSHGLRVSQ